MGLQYYWLVSVKACQSKLIKSLGYLINEAPVSNDQTHLHALAKREILKGKERNNFHLFFKRIFLAELI